MGRAGPGPHPFAVWHVSAGRGIVRDELERVSGRQAVGIRIVGYVRVGRWARCSRVLVPPRGVPPAPAPAMLNTRGGGGGRAAPFIK